MFNKSKHTIFLIHGIGGNKTHFGWMMQALKQILNKNDPQTRYIIKSIEYDTGHDEKTPYDFAKAIDKVIRKTTDSPHFKDEDKISLIMHSQGGLIGSIWMFRSLQSLEGYNTPDVIKHLDAFITLGTPFWGAKTAQFGREVKSVADMFGIKIPLPFGAKELEEMCFGSDMILNFRQAMIDPDLKQHIDYLKQNVRFLNIAAVADTLNPLGIFVSGSQKYEDDGAVPLASSRFNFLFSKSHKDNYQENDKVSLSQSEELDMAPFYVINAMHRSPVPNIPNFCGIAQIPKECIRDPDYPHPAYAYIWKHILGKDVSHLDQCLGDFKTFLIDLHVSIPEGCHLDVQDFNIEFFKLDGLALEKSNIEISNMLELYSEGRKRSKVQPHSFRFYYKGQIKRTMHGRKEAVLIKMSAKGLKTRLIEVPLRETFSTFVDINLIQ